MERLAPADFVPGPSPRARGSGALARSCLRSSTWPGTSSRSRIRGGPGRRIGVAGAGSRRAGPRRRPAGLGKPSGGVGV